MDVRIEVDLQSVVYRKNLIFDERNVSYATFNALVILMWEAFYRKIFITQNSMNFKKKNVIVEMFAYFQLALSHFYSY